MTRSPTKSTLLKASALNTGWSIRSGAVPGGGGDQVGAQAEAGRQGGEGLRAPGKSGRPKAALTAATRPSSSVARSSLRKAISSRAVG